MFVRVRGPNLFASFFFFNDTATTEIYTLSLHDALPIWIREREQEIAGTVAGTVIEESLAGGVAASRRAEDRKSTRLNSSHGYISYAVFCLKKKKQDNEQTWRFTHLINQP